MVHIDIEKLLESVEFQKRLQQKVSKLSGEVDVILTPDHSAACSLAARVHGILGIPMIRCNQDSVAGLSQSNIRQLQGRRILLIDDVVITGTRLHGFRNSLRKAGIINNTSVLHLLVGVARPTNTKSLQGIADMVYPRRNLHFIEKVTLPNWNERALLHEWCKKP